ncbi:MAG: PASTA domain-containing protein, partial [Sedimentisphaerales bacterium]|nr:PASTA domain-containing protein [Sedimentisphaerales bacterium]
GTVCIFIDSCFSGGAIKSAVGEGVYSKSISGSKARVAAGDGFAADLQVRKKDLNNTNVFVITASNDDEYSYEVDSYQNGLFTEYMLAAMRTGISDINANNLLSGEELYSYLNPLVVGEGYGQYPQLYDNDIASESDYYSMELDTPSLPGSGIESDPYRIATPADLIAMGEMVSEYGSCFALTNDIDMSGIIFNDAVIASEGMFTGSFNGNGHTISNLTIESSEAVCGLIGTLGEPGLVTDLALTSVNMIGGDYTGGLCGIVEYGAEIKQCYVSGELSGYGYTGGLCGDNTGLIIDCYSAVQVQGEYATGAFCGNNSNLIERCFSLGGVSVVRPSSDVYSFCGVSNGELVSCYYLELPGAKDFKAAGLTYSEMTDSSSFIGFDFTGDQDGTSDIWSIEQGIDYPRLSWQGLSFIAVPELAGWSVAPAQDILLGSGYKLGSQFWLYSDSVPAGQIISQMPVSGEQITLDRSIVVNISRGPSPYSGGSGSSDDPLRISSVGDLLLLSYRSKDYGMSFILTSDIDLMGMGDNPDGSFSSAVIAPSNGDWEWNGTPFSGSFDGNGKTISGLVIKPDMIYDDDYYEYRYLGLFGYISTGTVCDLTIADAYISSQKGSHRVGILAGSIAAGNVTAVEVSGSLLLSTSGDNESSGIGGLAGRADCSSQLSKCQSDVYISVPYNGYSIGGLLGSLGASDSENEHSSVSESCAHALIQVADSESVGGLIGSVSQYATVSDSYANGRIDNYGMSNGCGGLVGNAYNARIERCFAAVGMNYNEDDSYDVNGLIGYYENDWWSEESSDQGVFNCFWDQSISGLPVDKEYDGEEPTPGAALISGMMRDRETYRLAGWDLDQESENGTSDTWVVNNGSYPGFAWQSRQIMPDVRGMTKQEAIDALAASGIACGSVLNCYDNAVSVHLIAEQTPAAGTELISGQSIDLYQVIGRSPYSQGGSGCPGSPLKIASAGDLLLLSYRVQDYDKYIELVSDIDLTYLGDNYDGSFSEAVIGQVYGESWDWNYYYAPFRGVFDGNGHVISGMSLKPVMLEDWGYSENTGLFGFVKGARISDLKLSNCDISLEYGEDMYYEIYSVGLLAGYLWDSALSNIEVRGSVSLGADWCSSVGGVVGKVTGSRLDNVSMTGSLNIDSQDSYSIGGVAGRGYSYARLTRCSSYIAMQVNGCSNVGGLVGMLGFDESDDIPDGSCIDRCFAYADIVSDNGYLSAGGLLGSLYNAQVTDSYARGSITVLQTMDYCEIGGLINYMYNGSVNNCYAAVAMQYDSYSHAAGGLVSYCEWYSEQDYPSIYNSFWDTEFSGISVSFDPWFPDYGIGLTTQEMVTTDIYASCGWDFAPGSGVWQLDIPGSEYPRLSWQPYLSDLDGSGAVDIADLAILADSWCKPGMLPADIAPAGGDGVTDLLDFAVLSSEWLK